MALVILAIGCGPSRPTTLPLSTDATQSDIERERLACKSIAAIQEDALARTAEGVARGDAGDLDGARRAFAQAYAICPTPTVLVNLSQCEWRTGYPIAAARRLRIYLNEKHDGIDDVERKRASRLLTLIRQKLGAIQLSAPMGAPIWIDQRLLPRRYHESDIVELEAGSHVIHIEIDGHLHTRTIRVTAGKVNSVAF